MTERIPAWRCIGCGRIEAPETCIGVCQYRKVDFVYASEHEDEAALQRRRASAMEALLRQLAGTLPREGRWEESYRAFQEKARRVLAARDAEALAAVEEQG
jgi:hypothetical protein